MSEQILFFLKSWKI